MTATASATRGHVEADWTEALREEQERTLSKVRAILKPLNQEKKKQVMALVRADIEKHWSGEPTARCS